MSLLRLHRFAVLALVATAACRPAAPPEPVRLVGDPGIVRDERFLAWGGVVSIDDVPRPVISASRPIMVPTAPVVSEGRENRMRTTIPADLAKVPWVILESVALRGEDVVVVMQSWRFGLQAGNPFEYSIVPERLGPNGKPGVRIWPVPDLATRDVVTGDVAVPAGARLEVGLGLEPASWKGTVAPIDMKVAAVAGGVETPLHAERLDPRRPEHQRWVDATIPLDAFAGRTVRFRFTARASFGPASVPVLPVWADPTVVAGSP